MEQRNTIQKIKIIEYLKSVKTHPSAETVYNAIKKNIPTITLATVYRNLNQMAENDEILKLEINNEFRFDGDICNHQHGVCKKCGKLVDIFQEEINNYALKKVQTKEFIPECVNVIFKGLCIKCRGDTKCHI